MWFLDNLFAIQCCFSICIKQVWQTSLVLNDIVNEVYIFNFVKLFKIYLKCNEFHITFCHTACFTS